MIEGKITLMVMEEEGTKAMTVGKETTVMKILIFEHHSKLLHLLMIVNMR